MFGWRNGIMLLACAGLVACAGGPSRSRQAPVEDLSGEHRPPVSSLPVPAATSRAPKPAATQTAPAQTRPLARQAPPVSQDWIVDEPGSEKTPSAVGTLLVSADQASTRGDYGVAAATIERALRIEPRNAALWHRLAKLRMKQGKPRLAETLAVKSISLAGDDRRLLGSNWDLIAQARDEMGDIGGAREARNQAVMLH